jgi:hypothetical protein
MKKAINPIAARVEALPGRRLEAKWQQNLENVGGTFDRRDLENMWRNPDWSSKLTAENVIQSARLGVYGKPKENE